MIGKFIKNKHVLRLSGLLTVDGLLFAGSDAARVPSFIVMVGFLLLAVTLYYFIYAGLGITKVYGLKIRGRRQLALYLTVITAGLIALQSIGQLSQRDVTVLLPLAIIAYLYSAYAKTARRNFSG
ncbi:hypothetical protein COY17_02710 [Candidatus Saccharibacteria bacterium CG_4_10_14_0_2_um_filter_52_9]|nr:MAG: hypothetical protein COY17_02710 [Candidatus Saccharibacteria bacterium CG_4_10_14_0_2_um_filter_52_9]